MNSANSISVDNCVKIIELDDNGEFCLLEHEFKKVLASTKKYAQFFPVAVLTYIGSGNCDLGLFTKLFTRRLQGKEMWPEDSRNQNDESTYVLPTQTCLEEKTQSGVYWWPEVISVLQNSNRTVVLVLHVHINGLFGETQYNSFCELVKEVSTCCVSIVAAEKDKVTEQSPFMDSGILRSQRTNLGTYKHFILDTEDIHCDSHRYSGASFKFFNNTEKMIQILSMERSTTLSSLEKHVRTYINTVNLKIRSRTKNKTTFQMTAYKPNSLPSVDTSQKIISTKIPTNKSIPTKWGELGQNFNKICTKLKTLYEEEMNKVLALQNPVCPDLLLDIHKSFVEEMCKAFDFSSQDRNSFSNEVHLIFKKISYANLEILGHMQNKIRSTIASYKSKYETQMDIIIKEACCKNAEIELYEIHRNTKENLKLEMMNAVRQEISYPEPLEKHVDALDKGIEKSSKAFFDKVPSNLLKQPEIPKKNATLRKDGNGSVCTNLGISEDQLSVEGPFYGKHATKNHIHTAKSQKTDQSSDLNAGIVKCIKPDNQADKTEETPIRSILEEPFKTDGSCTKYALLLHLCSTKIGIATVEECPTYRVPEPLHDILYVSSQFAVTKNNKWLYGTTLTNERDIKDTFNLGTLLTKIEFENLKAEDTQFPYNPTFSHVFQLASFLSAVKQNVDLKKGIQISRLMIAVPRWLSCLNRQIIIEAAELARFEVNQCHLVSEAACSAFHQFKINPLNTPYNAVIVSENASKIDTSMYTYEKKKLTLFNYSSKAYRLVNNSYQMYDGKTGKLKSAKMEYFVNIQKSLRRAEKEAHKLNKCSLALTFADACTAGKEIENILRNDTTMSSVKSHNELVLYGLSTILSSLIEQNSSSVNLFLKESFCAFINAVSKNKELVSKKIVCEHDTQYFVELPYQIHSYFLNQVIFDTSFPIGVFKLHEHAIVNPKPKHITLEFLCDSNGVMTLREVFYKADKNKTIELNCSQYTWYTRNISANQKQTEKELFDEIRNYNIAAMELQKQVQGVIELGTDISKAIKNKQGDFIEPKNELGRLLVQRQVNVSLKALMQGVYDKEVLKHNRDILLNIKTQYKL